MKKLMSELKYSNKCYFSYSDSFTIKMNKINQDEILKNFKTLSLLYDNVIFSSAYLWASDEMSSIFNYLKPLIEKEILLPIIRRPNSTRDVKDYFDTRVKETSGINKNSLPKILLSTVENKSKRYIAEELDTMGSYVYNDNISTQIIFRELILSDLDVNSRKLYSIYNYLFVKLKTDYKITISYIKNYVESSYLSRASLSLFILKLKLSKEMKRDIILRISNLYLLANATSCKSDLLTKNQYSKSNLNIFLTVLEKLNISKDKILSLSSHEIIQIKSSEEYQNFLKFYNNIINSTSKLNDDYQNKIWGNFSTKLHNEEYKLKILSNIDMVTTASFGIFFVSLQNALIHSDTASTIVATTSSSIAVTSYILKKLSIFNDNVISQYVEYMVNEKYKDYYKNKEL